MLTVNLSKSCICRGVHCPIKFALYIFSVFFSNINHDFSLWLEFCQITSQPSGDINSGNVSASLLLPHLQNLFQQTAIQQVEDEVHCLCSIFSCVKILMHLMGTTKFRSVCRIAGLFSNFFFGK